MSLFTVGHSTRAIDEFIELLRAHGIRHVTDVRRFPGSRRHPQFGSEALANALDSNGIGYDHAESLGGRRQTSEASPNRAWRNASFRGYADHMLTAEFQHALDALAARAAALDVAIMCAEAVPWRCHRNLIADAAVARGVSVQHIVSVGRADEHVLSPHARVQADGRLRYPAPGDAQPNLL